MIQFGLMPGFSGFSSYQPQQAPATAAQPEAPQANHITSNSTMSAAGAVSMYPVAMMSPAYMMAYPQMAGPMAMAPMGMSSMGMPAMASDPAAGDATAAHVTANPTNSMAGNAMSGMAGYGGYGGVGVMGGFAMPMMMMPPVFLAMGYPVVFQGSQAQPPVTNLSTAEDVAAQTPDAPAVAETPAAPPVDTAGAVVDVVPEAKARRTSMPALPITALDAEDFARYRSVETSREQETSLSLELTTRDGDTISLDFKQLDIMESSRLRGRTLDGDKIRDASFLEKTDRVVNMDVTGDLSDAEKAAVDEVLATIIEVANKFFTGDLGQAVDKLKSMDFDGQQLAELSLNMSMSKSASVARAYHDGADHLHELKNRDADIGKALEFLATEQKRLIDVAKGIFDAPSAARLVRSLVPPLLSDPFNQLSKQVVAANLPEAGELESSAPDAEKELQADA